MSRKKTPEERSWNVALGWRIAERRRGLGLSQGTLGERLPGAGQQAVSKYELGASTPSAFALPALAQALETTVAELLGDSRSTGVAETGQAFVSLRSELNTSLDRMNVAAQRQVVEFARKLDPSRQH